MYWVWIFWFYSFMGCWLEKVFAYLTRSPHQIRKCFLLQPLCPVYGLSMVVVFLLPPDTTDTILHLAFFGGLCATAVEYMTHFIYEKTMGVMFWDYSNTKMDLNRRICMPFSVAWGILTVLAVWYVQPWVNGIIAGIPPILDYIVVLLLIVDSFFSVRVLRKFHNIDLMSLPALMRELQMPQPR